MVSFGSLQFDLVRFSSVLLERERERVLFELQSVNCVFVVFKTSTLETCYCLAGLTSQQLAARLFYLLISLVSSSSSLHTLVGIVVAELAGCGIISLLLLASFNKLLLSFALAANPNSRVTLWLSFGKE